MVFSEEVPLQPALDSWFCRPEWPNSFRLILSQKFYVVWLLGGVLVAQG